MMQGDKELLRKLESLKNKDAKAAIRKGTRAGAKIVQQRAKDKVADKSGTLRSNIKVRAMPRSKKWTGSKVTINNTGPEFYAAFVEFGTNERFNKAGKSSGKIVARHYIEKATKEVENQAVDKSLEIIKQEIEDRMKL